MGDMMGGSSLRLEAPMPLFKCMLIITELKESSLDLLESGTSKELLVVVLLSLLKLGTSTSLNRIREGDEREKRGCDLVQFVI